MDASWLGPLAEHPWSPLPTPLSPAKLRSPAGGETLQWSASTRQWLRDLGRNAGFVVVEPYVPEILNVTFEAEKRRWRNPLRHLVDPLAGTIGEMKRFGDFLTECQVDLAWLLPLPVALREFLGMVTDLDPCLSEHGLVFPELYGHVAVVGFELESSTGKHAAGGLLNLAAYCIVGVGVSPNAKSGMELGDILRRYQPTLGLRNIRVLVHP